TTLLRLVAGFEEPDAGTVSLADEIVSRKGYAQPPEKRNIAMVFQSYALWPHMSIAENVAFSLRVRRGGGGGGRAGGRDAGARGSGSTRLPSGARRSCPAASASAWRSRAALP